MLPNIQHRHKPFLEIDAFERREDLEAEKPPRKSMRPSDTDENLETGSGSVAKFCATVATHLKSIRLVKRGSTNKSEGLLHD